MGYANVRHNKEQHPERNVIRTSKGEKPNSFPRFVSPVQGESLVLVAHPSAMNYALTTRVV
jgi:hypothetical protein